MTDLALAISNSGNGETFHAILIMLILIITIIFCHYLIRLCMLSVRSKRHNPSGELVDQSRAGAVARPREPIRVILARDEELGLHEGNVVEEDKEIAVPPPPPAYGLWRCSVVSIIAPPFFGTETNTHGLLLTLILASGSESDPLATSRAARDLGRSTFVDAGSWLVDSTSEL